MRTPNAGEVLDAVIMLSGAIETAEEAGIEHLGGSPLVELSRYAHQAESDALGEAGQEIARLVFELIGKRPEPSKAHVPVRAKVFDTARKILELKGWPGAALDVAFEFAEPEIMSDGFAKIFGDVANAVPADAPGSGS